MNEFTAGLLWRIGEFFWPERPPRPLWALAGRTVLLLGVAAYGWRFLFMGMR